MRALVISSSFARSDDDPEAAAGASVRALFKELGQRFEGTILTPAIAGGASKEELGGFIVQRVQPTRPVEALHAAAKGVGALRVGRIFHSLQREARRLASGHDVAHGFWGWPGGLIATRLGIPSVVTFMGTDLNSAQTNPLARRVLKNVGTSADARVVVDPTFQPFLDSLQSPAEVIGTPFSLDVWPLLEGPQRSDTVAFVGRVAPEKGLDVLLRAIAIERSGGRAVHLEVAGDGPARSELEQLAVGLGIAQNVTWHGALRPAEIQDVFRRAQAVVIPSFREGLPAVALEALASGRPVVGSDAGGLPGLLRSAGVTCPSGDPAALAQALDDCLVRSWDPQALRAVVSGFDVTAAAAAYGRIYAELSRSTAASKC